MTILVGVLCKDGVVIGADSSATFAAGNMPTIEQPTLKIDIIAGQIIVAGTGPIGLGQRFCHVVQTGWTNNTFKGEPVEACRKICETSIKDFASTNVAQGQYGALVAFPLKQRLHLCEFALKDFQPELKTERIWYVSMGGGQLIVDPFLALMRKVFWMQGPPTHHDAAFAVTWALQHAIDVNPGGVNGPIRIAVLASKPNGEAFARMLTSEEVSAHENNVEAAQSHLRGYADILRGQGQQAVPDIPKPVDVRP